MKSKLKIFSYLLSLAICFSAVPIAFAMPSRNDDDAIVFRPERAFLMTRYGAGMRRYEDIEAQTHPIFLATERNNLRGIIRELTINPNAVNLVDIYGVTPIYISISQQAEEIVDYLVNHGANLTVTDRTGCTPLHRAAATENFNLVKTIIRSGRADINALNDLGETPLTSAIRALATSRRRDEQEQIIQYLIEHGATNPLEGVEEHPNNDIVAHAVDPRWFTGNIFLHN